MRPGIFLFLLLTAFLPAAAQTDIFPLGQLPDHIKPAAIAISRVSAKSRPPVQQKTTGLKERLVAWSYYYEEPGTRYREDTFQAWYSGFRGFEWDLSDRFFRSSIYQPLLFDFWYFDGAFIEQPDSVLHFMPLVSPSVPDVKMTATYDSNRLAEALMKQFDGAGYYDTVKLTFDYNTIGLPLQSIHYVSDTGAAQWLPFRRRSKLYDSTGYLLADTVFNYDQANGWVPYFLQTYEYDSLNRWKEQLIYNYDGSSFILSSRVLYTYTAGGQLQRGLQQILNGTFWDPVYKDTIGYDAAGNVTYESFWASWTSSSVPLQHLMTYKRQLNSDGLPSSVQILAGPAPGTLNRTRYYHYNAFGHPDSIVELLANNVSYYKDYFYYELYNDPTDVPVIGNHTVPLYPNPADNYISVDSRLLSGKEAMPYKIVNAAGQEVASGTLTSGTLIRIEGLLPGFYVLKLYDEKYGWLHAPFLKQ